MKRKIIFGTLVVAIMLLGTIIPLVTAETIDPGQQDYWIVHDQENPASGPPGQQYWFPEDQVDEYTEELTQGPWDEIWYTDLDDPATGGETGIRPIRNSSWKQNTWIGAEVTLPGIGDDVILHIKLYATPANNYPEYINWTVLGGEMENAYFRVRVYEWDAPGNEIVNFTISAAELGDDNDKLGRYVDQFRLRLDWYEE